MGFKIGKLFGRLAGGAGAAEAGEDRGAATDYKGYKIYPAARRQGSQWLTVGVIAKAFDEGEKEHLLIRADTYSSKEDADACAIRKAQQVIDEQGDKLFS